uniref:AGAP004959-RB n=1 Tax=Anopheles coluzzii TaxID=1518534 RepID=A0A0D3QCA6_ANOCL|nr:AGAP004959-RB [Anopheles coluzzii]AJC98437.1 AGAP004959-RB [Anopheles coluzzii]AJC98439.1 AGAP004959-RB [Anopheles coluzzii]AJC98465.1 AGAP004959-RB [Anopheles coluzzii]AJC98469.1 AGAP004959-RB [Anopheles coluzzii]
MVKFSNLIGTLFSKGAASKLETDAAPLPPRRKADAYGDETMAHTNTPAAAAAAATQNGNFPNGVQVVPGMENLALVPGGTSQSLEPVAGEHHTATPQTVVNNVQHNTLTAPQTSISNTTGMQVYQIRNASNLHIGNSYTFNTAAVVDEGASTSGSLPGAGSAVKWANLRLSNTISQMMQSQDEVDTELLDTVSRHLGYEWKSFARRLEYSEGQIDAFEADNSTLAEQIYSFMLDWTRNDDDPTLGRLVTLLWNNKHKETVYYIKQVWKKRKEDKNSPERSS